MFNGSWQLALYDGLTLREGSVALLSEAHGAV